MRNLEIKELCELSAYLFYYKNELIHCAEDCFNVDAAQADIDELNEKITTIEKALGIVSDDIQFRFEQ